MLAARAFRSDVEAGQAIGRAVGERAVTRGKADGSAQTWDGSGRQTGDGFWEPTPPGYFQLMRRIAGTRVLSPPDALQHAEAIFGGLLAATIPALRPRGKGWEPSADA